MAKNNVKQDASLRLVDLINDELDHQCDRRVYPNVCSRIGNPHLRAQIVTNVVNMVAKEGQTIPGAIAQLESSLGDSVS